MMKCHVSPSSPKSILLRDGMDLIVTRFPRSSTLLSDDIEKFIDNDVDVDAGYFAWKNQLEKPHRTTKVRGLRCKSTNLISGHLVSSKTINKGHRSPDKKNDNIIMNNPKEDFKHNKPSSSNHLIDHCENCHLNKRINTSKDKIVPYLSKQFHRMNIIQPALHRFKMFMHLNIAVPPTNTYRHYDIIYPSNLIRHTSHGFGFRVPTVTPPYAYYT